MSLTLYEEAKYIEGLLSKKEEELEYYREQIQELEEEFSRLEGKASKGKQNELHSRWLFLKDDVESATHEKHLLEAIFVSLHRLGLYDGENTPT